MKKYLISAGILLSCMVSFGQDAKEILKQAYDKCQSIQNGYYEMTYYLKYMDFKDTSVSMYHCSFKKLTDDTLYSSAFHYKYFWNGEYQGDVMYTGDDFIETNPADSTATIMSKTLWAKEIQSYAYNYKFYFPLTNRRSSPLPHDSDFVDNKHIFKFIGEVDLNGTWCYHIQVNELPENDSTEPMQSLRQEYNFWINKEDMIPIQYSVAFDMGMGNDTMCQFEKTVLNKYVINDLKDETILTLKSIPDYYRIKDFVPYKGPDLLKSDTIAPAWELLSLTDEKISLSSLQGQLVLIDFFYRACYPCMKALPALQDLSEKYKSKGLTVIGIDPIDKKEDDIADFLFKREVTYTVLLGGKDVAKDYRVSGYPTMYLIDRTGKIIFSQVGYGKGIDEILDDIIAKNL